MTETEGSESRVIATPPGAAGFSIDMIRRDMKGIPYVPVPSGFSVRAMTPDDAGLWTDIWRDAEPYFEIDESLFAKDFGDDVKEVGRRCFLLETATGEAVGTVSAWYDRNYRGMDYGRIHWLAVRRAYRGLGLGKALMTFAMNRLAQWHERAMLSTQSKRINAVKLYLDFDFVPNLDLPGAPDAWREVAVKLRHPALAALT